MGAAGAVGARAVTISGATTAPVGALIVIPGLTDGPESLAYGASEGSALSRACEERRWALVRFELSSSYDRYGTCTLDDDARDIDAVIAHVLSTRPSAREIALLGHSTGCQGVCHFIARGYETSKAVKRVVLQAGVSDRDWYEKDAGREVMAQAIARAETMAPDELMPKETPGTYGVATTARRFLSLAKPGGDDDWFSLDLFDGTREDASKIPKLTGCAHVDVRLVVSTLDEYVPYDASTVLAHAERVRTSFERVSKSARAHFIAANHDLSDMREEDVPGFVEFVFT